MNNNKPSSVDAYCNGCNAFICDELVTFEETCSNCGTQIEYFEDKMSNNKQTMKLYTEEEIKRLLKEQIIFDDEDFDKLTPIELPSDEEIHHECQIGGMDTNQQLCFQLGAKWMRDKIGGNNEQQ